MWFSMRFDGVLGVFGEGWFDYSFSDEGSWCFRSLDHELGDWSKCGHRLVREGMPLDELSGVETKISPGLCLI